MAKLSIVLFALLFAAPGFYNTQQQTSSGILVYADEGFVMPVEDVFSISGRGTIATGTIERGKVKVGDSVEIIGVKETIVKAKVTGIEAFRKLMNEGTKGDNVGLLLSGIDKSQVQRGMVICTPGAIKAHTEFKCQLTLKTKEDGGRSTPIFAKYYPFIFIRTHNVSGEVLGFEGKDELKPGESSIVTIKLREPAVMEASNEFVIKEGGRIVGNGKITEIIK